MSLPTEFLLPEDYFRASVDFLQAHSWIYCNANTRFIKAGVPEKFPQPYLDYFMRTNNTNLNKFPFLHEFDDINCDIDSTALKSFRSTLRKLIPHETCNSHIDPDIQLDLKWPKNQQRKMKIKKQHEIMQLSKIIQKHCQEMTLLLDFGAGLGYLSELLCSINPNWRILGLEADESRVAAAHKRLQQQIPEASERVSYVQQFIEANASGAIKQHIEHCGYAAADDKVLLAKWAIIGLHACADLTVTAIKLFFELSTVKRLIIMPCCYHKLRQASDTTSFLNFPLSAALKQVVSEQANTNIENYFNRPFLRLACQETSARWRNCTEEEHFSHGRQMFWRAIADAIIDHETEIISPVNKSQRPASAEFDLKSFANFCQFYELSSKEVDEQKSIRKIWSDEHENKFNEIVRKYAGVGPKLAEALTCLQTTLQKLCENIVLYDRLCYMQEYERTQPNLKLYVQFQKILDEKLSPRCYALIAEKLEP